jgi:hypothetical protein
LSATASVITSKAAKGVQGILIGWFLARLHAFPQTKATWTLGGSGVAYILINLRQWKRSNEVIKGAVSGGRSSHCFYSFAL